MGRMTIDVCSGPGSIFVLYDEWAGLATHTPWPVFSHPEWHLSWLDTFGRRATVSVLVARLDGSAVGILPLCRRRLNKHGLFLPISEPLSGPMADYCCPVVSPDHGVEAFGALIQRAWDDAGDGTTFVWPNLPVTDAGADVIRALAAERHFRVSESAEVCPRLAFAKDYAATEARWDRSHRGDVRRQRRRLEALGPLELRIARTREEMLGFLPEFFEVHTQKWHSEGQPGKLNSPLLQKYYVRLVERMWDKGVHISTLVLQGKPISYHFGFLTGGWLLWYLPTYRKEYHSYSPSKVHISALIEHGIGQGWRGFDLLRGGEPYKFRWATETLKSVSLVIGRRPVSPSYWWLAEGKPLVQRKVGGWYAKASAFLDKLSSRGTGVV